MGHLGENQYGNPVTHQIECAFCSLAPTFPVRAKNTSLHAEVIFFVDICLRNKLRLICVGKLPNELCPCLLLRLLSFLTPVFASIFEISRHVHFEEVIFVQYIKWLSWWLSCKWMGRLSTSTSWSQNCISCNCYLVLFTILGEIKKTKAWQALEMKKRDGSVSVGRIPPGYYT